MYFSLGIHDPCNAPSGLTVIGPFIAPRHMYILPYRDDERDARDARNDQRWLRILLHNRSSLGEFACP